MGNKELFVNKANKSKRTFFKKMAAAIGFLTAAGYLSNLMSGRANLIRTINDNSANDVNMQKKAWLQKQFAPMTDKEKKQMLDEIFDNYNKYHA
jgi:hypothetical protein